MSDPIDFYYDFVSPYAYLGSIAVGPVAARHGREVRWRPILLGVSVLQVMGLKPVPDTPLKGTYAAHDWPRSARLLGIAHDPRAPLLRSSLTAMRAVCWLDERDRPLSVRLAAALFAAHWAGGRDIAEPDVVADVAAGLDLDAGELLAAIASPAVKQRLRDEVDAAIARGVFGAPTFIVDSEMFWGADRLPQVDRWLETGGW